MAQETEEQRAHKSTMSQHRQVAQISFRVLVLRREGPDLRGLCRIQRGLVHATAWGHLGELKTPPGKPLRKSLHSGGIQHWAKGLPAYSLGISVCKSSNSVHGPRQISVKTSSGATASLGHGLLKSWFWSLRAKLLTQELPAELKTPPLFSSQPLA